MVVSVRRRAIGVFSNRTDVENALHELKNSGFSMDRISVIAKDADRRDDIAGTPVEERIGDKSDEGAATGAVTGGVLGGLTGLLVGLGTLAIPGIGPIMLAGATATTLATTIAGAGIGAAAGSLIGALIGLGIPEERARVYNERVERGHYLVIIDGTDAEIATVEAIFNRHRVEEFGVYDHPNSDYATADVVNQNVASTTHGDRINTSVASSRTRRAIGVFAHRLDAEAALKELRDAGFPMTKVSVIAKDRNGHHDAGLGNKADDGAKAGAATGGALGGLGGLLVGLGALALPGIGPVIAGGAVATALATTVAGGAIGAAAGGIVGALVGLGIPEDRARVYSDRFNQGDYIVIVDGTESEINHAEAILRRRGIEEYGIYDAPDVDREHHHNFDRVSNQTSAYSATGDRDDPSVVIIDHRDAKI